LERFNRVTRKWLRHELFKIKWKNLIGNHDFFIWHLAKQKGRNDVVYYEMKLEEKIHEKIENNVLEPIKPRFGLEIEKNESIYGYSENNCEIL